MQLIAIKRCPWAIKYISKYLLTENIINIALSLRYDNIFNISKPTISQIETALKYRKLDAKYPERINKFVAKLNKKFGYQI